MYFSKKRGRYFFSQNVQAFGSGSENTFHRFVHFLVRNGGKSKEIGLGVAELTQSVDEHFQSVHFYVHLPLFVTQSLTFNLVALEQRKQV